MSSANFKIYTKFKVDASFFNIWSQKYIQTSSGFQLISWYSFLNQRVRCIAINGISKGYSISNVLPQIQYFPGWSFSSINRLLLELIAYTKIEHWVVLAHPSTSERWFCYDSNDELRERWSLEPKLHMRYVFQSREQKSLEFV